MSFAQTVQHSCWQFGLEGSSAWHTDRAHCHVGAFALPWHTNELAVCPFWRDDLPVIKYCGIVEVYVMKNDFCAEGST